MARHEANGETWTWHCFNRPGKAGIWKSGLRHKKADWWEAVLSRSRCSHTCLPTPKQADRTDGGREPHGSESGFSLLRAARKEASYQIALVELAGALW